MRVIHVLRKPLSEGTVAANTLKHGVGGLNIDASRVGTSDHFGGGSKMSSSGHTLSKFESYEKGSGWVASSVSARWPANVILHHSDGCRCDGTKKVKGTGTAYEPAPKAREHMIYGDGRTLGRTLGYAEEDGKETVADWICEPGCPVARLDARGGSTTSKQSMRGVGWSDSEVFGAGDPGFDTKRGYDDEGGVSRFFKQVGGTTDG